MTKKKRIFGKRSGLNAVLYTYVESKNRKYLSTMSKKSGLYLSTIVNAMIAAHRTRKPVSLSKLKKAHA